MNDKYLLPGRAIQIATKYHEGQVRKWGSKLPCIVHPLRVAVQAGSYLLSEHAVAAAICHDLFEDTTCPRELINDQLGYLTLGLVDWLTNNKDPSKTREARKSEERVRLAQAPLDARIIKAYDRLDNLATVSGAPEKFRAMYLEESRLLFKVLEPLPASLSAEIGEFMLAAGDAW